MGRENTEFKREKLGNISHLNRQTNKFMNSRTSPSVENVPKMIFKQKRIKT